MTTDLGRTLTQTGITLLGAGGHASEILTVIESYGMNPKPTVVVADENRIEIDRFAQRGVEQRAMVDLQDLQANGSVWPPFIAAIGYPQPREAMVKRALAAGLLPFGPLVCEQATIGARSQLAEGCVVMGNAWLSPLVSVAEHTHISYGVCIGHDTQIGAFCAILPAASIAGNVSIGAGVLIGANATILPGLSIGAGAIVGAGAVVTRSVPAKATVAGNPAREMDK